MSEKTELTEQSDDWKDISNQDGLWFPLQLYGILLDTTIT